MKHLNMSLASLITLSIIAQASIVDFDVSLGRDDAYYRSRYIDCMQSQGVYGWAAEPLSVGQLHNLYKELYDKNNLEKITSYSHQKIPYVVHMIWLGKEFPARYAEYRRSWLELTFNLHGPIFFGFIIQLITLMVG